MLKWVSAPEKYFLISIAADSRTASVAQAPGTSDVLGHVTLVIAWPLLDRVNAPTGVFMVFCPIVTSGSVGGGGRLTCLRMTVVGFSV